MTLSYNDVVGPGCKVVPRLGTGVVDGTVVGPCRVFAVIFNNAIGTGDIYDAATAGSAGAGTIQVGQAGANTVFCQFGPFGVQFTTGLSLRVTTGGNMFVFYTPG